jgi:NAD(P)-dependent dehydrogenase (short-subunit alcohol dehydrogenase family)
LQVAAERVAIVTGANRGIGLEICRQLARAGIRVVLTSRDAAQGKAACKALTDARLPAVFHKLDVTSARSIKALAAFVKSKFGRADILVNNAGVMLDPRGTRFLDSALDTYRATFDTNVWGPLLLTQALLPPMRKRGYGRIVNLSSGLGQLAAMANDTPAYRMSKTALNALTRIVAVETAGTNVLVNAACPGWVRTDMRGAGASLSVTQGADTPVWLATLPDGGPTGGYFRERKPIAW